MTKTDDRPIDSITIGQRHRKSVGDITSLAASIERDGLLHPVVITPDGTLIAGERRIRACEALGWKKIPVRVLDVENIVRAEAAENFERQDFTLSEAVAIKRALGPEMREEAEARMRAGRPSANFAQGPTREKIAAFTGFSHETLRKAETIVAAAEAEPERFGKLVEDMDRHGKAEAVFRRLSNIRQGEKIRAEPPPLPTGPYRVIVADPPWPYEFRMADPTHRGVCPYPLMTLADITALPVMELAADDAVLWLWVPNFHLVNGAHVAILDAWGFSGRTMLTWAKNHYGYGDWLRGQTEHAILAVRGHPVVTNGHGQPTLLTAPVRGHSQKPDEFYSLVESLCPAPRYLELFARKARPGWDVWGDEVAPEYDSAKDMNASVEACYEAIRQRQAAGGPGFDPDRMPPDRAA